jgi:chemotaxis response regulator CheB
MTAPIVDDVPRARKRIRSLLQHAASGRTMIDKAANREEALRIADEQAPGDVVLHGGTRLQMSRARSRRPDGSWQ